MAKALSEKKKAEMRVAVAKDVLARLRLKWFKADAGTYMDFLPKGTAKTMRGLLRKKPAKPCHVCALGGLFLSGQKLHNGMAITDSIVSTGKGKPHVYVDRDDMRDHDGLGRYFSQQQLEDIEACFEGWWGPDGVGLKYYDQFPKDGDRLRAIAKNIVRNKGTFVPEQDLA